MSLLSRYGTNASPLSSVEITFPSVKRDLQATIDAKLDVSTSQTKQSCGAWKTAWVMCNSYTPDKYKLM